MDSRQIGHRERELHSQACRAGRHAECGHWDGSRSAFRLRRLRRESFPMLCGCDCHSPCPVARELHRVDDQAWRQWCTCPGAADMRRILDEHGQLRFDVRDFAEMWARSRDELKTRRRDRRPPP